MTTAASEGTKKNNIYDMAGNLWEWTEELAYDMSNNYYIIRGRFFQQCVCNISSMFSLWDLCT